MQDRQDLGGVNALPNSENFRHWVQDALAELGFSANLVSRSLSLGRNTLGDFLRDSGRSIHLDTAAKVTAYLRTQAALKGVTLRRLEGVTHG